MEKKTTQATRTGVHAAGGRSAARPSGAADAKRSTGAHSSAGAARPKSGAAARPGTAPKRAATAKGGARAAKGGAASARRSQQKRRKGTSRRAVRARRQWLLIGAGALVIVIAIVLALTLTLGGGKDSTEEAVPASVEDAAASGAEGDTIEGAPMTDSGAGEDAIEGTPVADSGAEDDVIEGEPVADSGAEEGASSDVAIVSSESEIASQLSPEMIALMQKYKVLDGIPNTAEPLGIPEGARAEDSYFDDALFVGDSVTLKLQRYVSNTRKMENPNLLGQARFLAAQSFSARNALMNVSEKSIHPVIEGVKMPLEDAIAKLAPKKLYLMLGMNDVGVSGIDGALENMSKLLARIREKNPDMRIIVESATPRLKGTHPTTNQLFAFDVQLYDAILQMNDPMIEFIDIAYAMRDAEGKLVEEYCDDPNNMAIHFTNAGCRQWIDYLYTHPSTAA